MRSIISALFILALSLTNAMAQTAEENKVHALHGLVTMYAAGMVCYYNKWSFSKQDTDEMLAKIKELGNDLPKKTNDDMWTQAQQIMAEGQATANEERCTQVRQQYAIAHPFLFGTPAKEQQAPL